MGKFLPLALFVVLAYFLLDGLGRDTKKLPSPLIGKNFPNIEVVDFHTGEKFFTQDRLKDKFSLVNVWASWCATCHVEHQMLINIAKSNSVQMMGINYKDKKKSSTCVEAGKLGLELGVYRVPETFLVNDKGVIIFKHLGEVTPSIWKNDILPLINPLKK